MVGSFVVDSFTDIFDYVANLDPIYNILLRTIMKKFLIALLIIPVIVMATMWDDITDPNQAISIINLTTNDVSVQGVKFKAAYTNSLGNTIYTTNDLGLFLSREQINFIVLYGLYNLIDGGKLTNIVAGHLPVSNF